MKKIYTILFMLATVLGYAQAPTTTAPSASYDAADVISLWSDAYTNVTVGTWRTGWSAADLAGHSVDNDTILVYNNLNFVGIEPGAGNFIDASSMDHFNLDVWTPDATTFRVKLVDFGADAAFGGGDDTEHELAFESLNLNAWNTLHIPLADFANMTSRTNIAQIIFSAIPVGTASVYLDNMYFSKEPVEAVPTTGAADPTADAANVISLFSNVYTDATVGTWRTDWSAADLEDIQVDGNDVKKYSNLNFVGVEPGEGNSIDATDMETIHMDVWTPNATTYRIKLVDFGADGAFGGGDDTEHEIAFEDQPTETWNTHDIALADFTGMTARANISQIIFSALPVGEATLYLDNIYFSKPATENITKASFTTLNVYPNPANNVLNLNLDANGATINNVEIVNIQGQKMITVEYGLSRVNESLNISSLSSGVYFVNINTANGTVTSRVVVK